jgi:23S rRNA (cytidine1920-2'-O)/16S rRNA (cytidine1409-2'-O)-methyltransferase
MHTGNAKNSLVSRAGEKLAGAAQAFSYDFRGKTVLDIGSSTGGFTEVALKMGAERIFAVEKGTKQMKAPLRFDPKISLYEKTDIFDTAVSEKDFLVGDEKKQETRKSLFDTIVADVSFVSLTKVLAYAKMYLACRETDFLVMLKPQFEADEKQLNRGVVKNEKIRREIIFSFEKWLKSHGFLIVKKRDNTLAGKNGNVERFYWLKIAK